VYTRIISSVVAKDGLAEGDPLFVFKRPGKFSSVADLASANEALGRVTITSGDSDRMLAKVPLAFDGIVASTPSDLNQTMPHYLYDIDTTRELLVTVGGVARLVTNLYGDPNAGEFVYLGFVFDATASTFQIVPLSHEHMIGKVDHPEITNLDDLKAAIRVGRVLDTKASPSEITEHVAKRHKSGVPRLTKPPHALSVALSGRILLEEEVKSLRDFDETRVERQIRLERQTAEAAQAAKAKAEAAQLAKEAEAEAAAVNKRAAEAARLAKEAEAEARRVALLEASLVEAETQRVAAEAAEKNAAAKKAQAEKAEADKKAEAEAEVVAAVAAEAKAKVEAEKAEKAAAEAARVKEEAEWMAAAEKEEKAIRVEAARVEAKQAEEAAKQAEAKAKVEAEQAAVAAEEAEAENVAAAKAKAAAVAAAVAAEEAAKAEVAMAKTVEQAEVAKAYRVALDNVEVAEKAAKAAEEKAAKAVEEQKYADEEVEAAKMKREVVTQLTTELEVFVNGNLDFNKPLVDLQTESNTLVQLRKEVSELVNMNGMLADPKPIDGILATQPVTKSLVASSKRSIENVLGPYDEFEELFSSMIISNDLVELTDTIRRVLVAERNLEHTMGLKEIVDSNTNELKSSVTRFSIYAKRKDISEDDRKKATEIVIKTADQLKEYNEISNLLETLMDQIRGRIQTAYRDGGILLSDSLFPGESDANRNYLKEFKDEIGEATFKAFQNVAGEYREVAQDAWAKTKDEMLTRSKDAEQAKEQADRVWRVQYDALQAAEARMQAADANTPVYNAQYDFLAKQEAAAAAAAKAAAEKASKASKAAQAAQAGLKAARDVVNRFIPRRGPRVPTSMAIGKRYKHKSDKTLAVLAILMASEPI
jgi:hypothetical protein